jgi:1,4-dihydroxy-2-naphthoyl-CoA hydrolase
VFRYSTELNLRDTDAAGVAFFAAYYAIAHNTYEAFLKGEGAPLHSWLDQVHLPIIRSEADYTAPIKLGTSFEVHLSCAHIGERSFVLHYEFLKDLKSLAQVKTVHVAVNHNKDDGSVQAVPLPERFKSLLLTMLSPSKGSSVEPKQNQE